MTTQYPLREKRRRASRASLIKAARELFVSQGFSKTTLEDIAELAGLHVQTLYRHFPSKQSLAVVVQSEEFKEAFSKREIDTMSFWRIWTEKVTQITMSEDGGISYLKWRRERHNEPKLESVLLELQKTYQDIMAEGIAADLNLDPEQDQFPVLVSCLLWTANMHAIEQWEKMDGRGDLVNMMVTAIDEVIKMSRHLHEWRSKG